MYLVFSRQNFKNYAIGPGRLPRPLKIMSTKTDRFLNITISLGSELVHWNSKPNCLKSFRITITDHFLALNKYFDLKWCKCSWNSYVILIMHFFKCFDDMKKWKYFRISKLSVLMIKQPFWPILQYLKCISDIYYHILVVYESVGRWRCLFDFLFTRPYFYLLGHIFIYWAIFLLLGNIFIY